MMCLRFYALIILAVISASEAEELSTIVYVSAQKVTSSQRHECVVKLSGVTRIYLLEEKGNNRSYWVTCSSGMLKSFLVPCIGKWKCTIRQNCPLTYRLDNSQRFGLEEDNYKGLKKNTEYAISQFMESLTHGIKIYKGHQHKDEPQNWKHDMAPFIRKQDLRIPVVLGRKSSQKVKEAETVNDPMSEKVANSQSSPRPKKLPHGSVKTATGKVIRNVHAIESAVQCIFGPGYTQGAVCHECLAMHSKWIGIQTYQLMYKERFSGELCVFSTIYRHDEIIENCENTFCQHIYPLDLGDCETFDKMFPKHQRRSENFHKKLEFTEKSRNSLIFERENVEKKEKDIDKIMDHIALKRMARSRDKSSFQFIYLDP